MSGFFFHKKNISTYRLSQLYRILPFDLKRTRTGSEHLVSLVGVTYLLGNEKTKRTLDLEDDKTRIDLLDLDPDLDLHWNGIITEGFL